MVSLHSHRGQGRVQTVGGKIRLRWKWSRWRGRHGEDGEWGMENIKTKTRLLD